MGGGGDGGFAAAQAEEEAKKQAARDALNLQFGVAPTGPAPTREQFTNAISQGVENIDGTPTAGLGAPVFDEAGYNAALAAWNGAGGEAEKNKAAREALYGTVRGDAFNAGKRRLDESRDKASRDLRFTLFGQGLNGGSVDIDENALLGRTYDQGTLDLGAKADSTATDLRNSDEQTRLGLLQSIDAGLDQGSALSSSLNQLKVNSDRAAAEGQGTALGDLFGTAGLLYGKSEAARGQTEGQKYWNTFPSYGARKPTGNTGGIISSTG